jgi:hypothetical protein
MKIIEIIEARRNPDKNVKIDFELQLMNHFNSLSDSEKDNWFVHFTRTPKLGIKVIEPTLEENNPSPLGIYCYRLKDIISLIKNEKIFNYFVDMNFAYLFKADNTKILSRSTASTIDNSEIKSQLLSYIKNKFPDKVSEVKSIIDNITNDSLSIFKSIQQTFITIYNYDMNMRDIKKYKSLSGIAKEMNFILRKIGFHGIQGFGDIERDEVVILSPSLMTNVKLIEVNTEYYSHASDSEKIKPRDLDKIDPSTGKKLSRYPTRYSEPDDDGLINLPQSRTSFRQFVANAIRLANKGKVIKDREKAEKMLFSYSPFGHRRDDQMGEVEDHIKAYKSKVLDKLGLNWTNPKYEAMYQKMMTDNPWL